MPAIQAKICGLKTPEAIAAAVDGGAAYLGFVFFDKSPRWVSPQDAARLVAPVRQGSAAQMVALTVDPADADLDYILAAFMPDLIQLHGLDQHQIIKRPRIRDDNSHKALQANGQEVLAVARQILLVVGSKDVVRNEERIKRGP
jgi:phosphoribosylanthranilate isomerase